MTYSLYHEEVGCEFCGETITHRDDCPEILSRTATSRLQSLPASGKVHARYAVIVNDEQIGEVMQVTMRGNRRMLGNAVAWVTKPAENVAPIWSQWFNSAKEAAAWMTSIVEARKAQTR